MLLKYHVSITRKALSEQFSHRAMQTILAANLKQDHLLTGQIGHDAYHYDNNAIAEASQYMQEQRQRVISCLENDNLPASWTAFGRLLHTAQDFYAHSNYVDLWLARFQSNGQATPPPSAIPPLVDELVRSPDLCTGKLYLPWEVLAFLPGIKRFVIPLLPADSHAHMHLDSPARGERFTYAFEAAVKRTRYELDQTMKDLPSGQEALFKDLA